MHLFDGCLDQPTILGLIDRLAELGFPRIQRTDTESIAPSKDAMPTWMRNLLAKMVSNDTTANVRLFIAKMVVNRARIFQPFAEDWFR